VAVYARRAGNTWFLGVLCGPQAKTIRMPLSFLGGRIEDTRHEQGDALTLELRAGGGFMARFSKP